MCIQDCMKGAKRARAVNIYKPVAKLAIYFIMGLFLQTKGLFIECYQVALLWLHYFAEELSTDVTVTSRN